MDWVLNDRGKSDVIFCEYGYFMSCLLKAELDFLPKFGKLSYAYSIGGDENGKIKPCCIEK